MNLENILNIHIILCSMSIDFHFSDLMYSKNLKRNLPSKIWKLLSKKNVRRPRNIMMSMGKELWYILIVSMLMGKKKNMSSGKPVKYFSDYISSIWIKKPWTPSILSMVISWTWKTSISFLSHFIRSSFWETI